jgi:hypothetical protein
LFWKGFGVLKERELSHNMMQAALCFLKITKGIFLYKSYLWWFFFQQKNFSDTNMRVLSRHIQSFIMTLQLPFLRVSSFLIQAWEIVQKLHHYWYFCPSQSRRGPCRFFISYQINQKPSAPWRSQKFCVIFNFIISMHIISL